MRSFPIAVAAFLGLAAFPGAVAAEPQALLVASDGDVQLLCEAGECAADVSTICLQQDRSIPDRGTLYTVFREGPGAGQLALVGLTEKGVEAALPVDTPLVITAERDHLAVKVSVPEAVLKRSGFIGAKVRLSGAVVLVPETADDDLSVALGGLRAVAKNVLKARDEQLVAARLSHDLVNLLPRRRDVGAAEYAAAWSKVVAASGPIPEAALDHAQWGVRHCLELTKLRYPLRRCTGEIHNVIMDEVNQDYWDALNFGS